MPIDVVMPALGLTVEKGKVLKWLKMEGEPVKKGDPIFEVEADKVTTEVESPATGILRKILVPEAVEVPILTVVAVITSEDEEIPKGYLSERKRVLRRDDETPGGMQTSPGPAGAIQGSSRLESPRAIKAVPAARRAAREHRIDLSLISGSGPEGTILKKDVEAFAALSVAGKAGPKGTEVRATTLARKLAEREGVPLDRVPGSSTHGRVVKMDVMKASEERTVSTPPASSQEKLFGGTIAMTSMRKVIARRMVESARTAPHIHLFTDVEMDRLLGLRDEIIPRFEADYKVRISINDFILKAVGLSIREYPVLNARVEGETLHISPQINVGLAVALDEGLIVPAIPETDRMGLGEIAKTRLDLVERARSGQLKPDEIERGTFTVSSLAGFEITCFTAILNPPQTGILSVGKLDEKLTLTRGEISSKRVTCFGLSVDHRVIDGVVAARFLETLKNKLENPVYAFLQL